MGGVKGVKGVKPKRRLNVGAYSAFLLLVRDGYFWFNDEGRAMRRRWGPNGAGLNYVAVTVVASRGNRNGYRRIPFRLGGVRFEVMEHVALWIHETGKWPRAGEQVNHKDLDRGNGRLENLELVTQGENLKHAHAMRRNGARGGRR